MTRSNVPLRWPAAIHRSLAVVVLALLGVVVPATSAAAGTIVAEGVQLATSASCAYGDVDLTYAATGVTDASLSFTAADGSVLESYAGAPFRGEYSGTENVLSDAEVPPPAGTVLGVYVWIGSAPPAAATTAEFFVLYRCDAVGNDDGGSNVVLSTCVGPYGTCPQTAQEALEPTTTTTAGPSTSAAPGTSTPPLSGGPSALPAARPAQAVVGSPRFTG